MTTATGDGLPGPDAHAPRSLNQACAAPLEGARVWSPGARTAPAPWSPLRAAGAEPLLLPLIDFERAADQHSLDVAFDALGRGGLRLARDQQRNHRPGARRTRPPNGASALRQWLPAARVATIGPATRAHWRPGASPSTSCPQAPAIAARACSTSGPRARPGAPAAGGHRRPHGWPGLEARAPVSRPVTAYHTVDYPAIRGRSLPPARRRRCRCGTPTALALLTPAEAKAELGAGRLHAVVAASPSAARRIHAASHPWAPAVSLRSGDRRRRRLSALGLTVAAVGRRAHRVKGWWPRSSGPSIPKPARPPTSIRQQQAPSEGQDMSFPNHRPRRLRTTPAMRRLTAETPACARGADPARLHPRGPHRTQSDRLHAGRGAAHHRYPQACRRRGRGAGRGRNHAVRHSGGSRRRRHRVAGSRTAS